jgi:hypothetical protein
VNEKPPDGVAPLVLLDRQPSADVCDIIADA